MAIEYQVLRNIKLEHLRRLDLGNDLSFTTCFEFSKRLYDTLLKFEGLRTLLPKDADFLAGVNSEFMSFVSQIRDFTVATNESRENTIARRNKIISRFETFYIEHWRNLELLFLILSGNDSTSVENKIDSKVQDFDRHIGNSREEVQKRVAQIDNLLATANDDCAAIKKIKSDTQNQSVKQLSEKYGSIFESQATKNFSYAILFGLLPFILGTVAIIIFCYGFFNPFIEEIRRLGLSGSKEISLEYVLISTVFRLVLLGLGYSVVREFLKIFHSNIHLYHLNTHRQNALKSFNTLIQNTDTSEVRDQIIKDISQTIYSNQNDGYLSGDKKNISLMEITELIKALK